MPQYSNTWQEELQKIQEKRNAKLLYLKPEEAANLSFLRNDRLFFAQNIRDSKHPEFDDQTYLEWYDSNKKAAYSFIPKKQNKEDTRIVTGTTEEKEISLLSMLLNFNFNPNVQAFSENDDIIRDLGETMEDLIKKSYIIEKPVSYDVKRIVIYKELLDQGDCFVEEIWKEQIRVSKEISKKISFVDDVKIDDIKWEKQLKKSLGQCEANLISGEKVFLGNIKEFYIQRQPYIFTVETRPYSEVEKEYKNWERWQYVPMQIVSSEFAKSFASTNTQLTYIDDWSLYTTNENYVEIIKYQDKWSNEFQILLNGIPMLPAGFPLTAISPSGEYTISKGSLNPISKFFAYSKSIPAKTKVMQAVKDEFFKLMILKTQQSFKPPLANNSQKILSRDIFMPGHIENNLNPNDIAQIGDNRGVTQSEFNMFALINEIINEASLSRTFEGNPEQGSRTATEIESLRKNSMQKIGYPISGVMSLENQVAEKRLYNLLENWTKEDSALAGTQNLIFNSIRSFVVDTTFKDGKRGKRVVSFTDKQLPSPKQIQGLENILSTEKFFELTRVYFLNPSIIKAMNLVWYITIEPTEKRTDQLDREMLKRDITDLQLLFESRGIQINYENLMDEMARSMKKNRSELFIENQQQPNSQMAQMMAQTQEQRPQQPFVGSDLVNKFANRPSGRSPAVQR